MSSKHWLIFAIVCWVAGAANAGIFSLFAWLFGWFSWPLTFAVWWCAVTIAQVHLKAQLQRRGHIV